VFCLVGSRCRSKIIDQLLVVRWDRFSRNAPESRRLLNEFQKLGIKVNAVEQPIDFDHPEQKLMLAFYLNLSRN
jgi:DNA invertase Pin-like site-specific DNA recombinase